MPEGSSQAGARVVSLERMLTEYLRLAMMRAHYELLGEGEGFYGEIPGFQGVLAQAETLEAAVRSWPARWKTGCSSVFRGISLFPCCKGWT